MKIVIQNQEIEFNLACRILKTKGGECPFDELQEFWNDIEPLSFKDIAQIENLETRRLGLLYLGTEKLISQINPTLLNKETISKKTTWVTEQGELVEHTFDDTYELYKVGKELLGIDEKTWSRNIDDAYYIKCKDTSTDREYLIWVDINSIWRIKTDEDTTLYRWEMDFTKIDAIDCIAWTIQTNVPKGNIEKIVRQGDCILIKPKGSYQPLPNERHLTKQEYLTLLVAES